jgi:hypothetical protein
VGVVGQGTGGQGTGGGQFDQQVAIVTGGSNGMGRAITEAMINVGGSVAVCDLVDSGYFGSHVC